MVKAERKHWIFKKHTSNINVLIEVALMLKSNKSSVSKEDKIEMFRKLERTGGYNPRESIRNKPLDSINHRISELSYYMFGYADTLDKEKKFIFSPLGNLFLKYLDNPLAKTKIFTTMLMAIQFPHPVSQPSEEFKLYPFRLILQLLRDKRLEGKLYNYEIYRYLIYIDEMDASSYEKLVNQLLESRALDDNSKFNYLKNNEYKIVKSVYEWQYYVSKIIQDIGVINRDDGDKYVELYHEKRKNSKSQTKRKANNGYFELNKKLFKYVDILLEKYTIYQEPLKLNFSERESNDIVKEIYSFYPEELLIELGEPTESIQSEMLRLPKLIEEYALNKNNETANKFEDILEDAFNMFYNVTAQKLSGAGQTDIESMYLVTKEKFAVEAKSTANKLSSINAGRLRRHRELIGAKYTIVITPRYVPSVKYDIKDQDIVIIKANTLSEYLYNYIISNVKEIDYQELQEIILDNLGTDISLNISELTLTKFG